MDEPTLDPKAVVRPESMAPSAAGEVRTPRQRRKGLVAGLVDAVRGVFMGSPTSPPDTHKEPGGAPAASVPAQAPATEFDETPAEPAPTAAGAEASAQETSEESPAFRAAGEPGADEKANQPTEEPAPRPAFKATTRIDDLIAVDDGLGDLPHSYDQDRAVLLVRDPYWIHAYWDISTQTLGQAAARGDHRQILRVQEWVPSGRHPGYFYDVPVPTSARNWYLRLPGDGRSYRVEIALQFRQGGFETIAVSNLVEVPADGPSPIVADRFVDRLEEPSFRPHGVSTLPRRGEWTTAEGPWPDELAPDWGEIAGDSPMPPSPAMPEMPSRLMRSRLVPRYRNPSSADNPWMTVEEELEAPGGPSSAALSSHAWAPSGRGPSPSGAGRPKSFWLVADAEVIVYGATEPDAVVTFRGERIPLAADGTFRFHFHLPDGTHPMPIRAVNADGDDERGITITVGRGTEGDGRTNLRLPS
ncbi:MAG: DUF4912 domain-containing protein [Candidatus Sericytochromatia bacterium]|nr:DUF4912 domain-containing protein [Candidatus Sericytochromatia bacterium]